MRIYDGSPRQDFEEVLRSIGAFLDARGMRDISLVEVPDGFVVQGLVAAGGSASGWSEAMGTVAKETVTFVDDDIARFMEDGAARRGHVPPEPAASSHELALRVIGRWIDEQKPRDILLFEQDGSYVLRLHAAGQQGSHHEIAEFTRDDLTQLVAKGPSMRKAAPPAAKGGSRWG